MNDTVVLNELVAAINGVKIIGVAFASAWGIYKIAMEIISKVMAKHDRDKSIDEMALRISQERADFAKQYDEQLAEIRKTIAENHADTEAKLQQMYAEQYIMTDCIAAILDGLHQQGCNGKVTAAIEELGEHIKKRAYGMK